MPAGKLKYQNLTRVQPNQGLNLKIPYTYEGRAANYVPDFLIRLRDQASTGPDDLLTLVLEVTDPWDAEHLIRAKYLEPCPVEAPTDFSMSTLDRRDGCEYRTDIIRTWSLS
jgi:hypothetical protein